MTEKQKTDLTTLFNKMLVNTTATALELLPNDFNADEFSCMSLKFIEAGMKPSYVSRKIIEAIEGALTCANQ